MDSNGSTQVNTIKRCRVCGGKAVCYNFDVLTCGPCRLFFYRNVHKNQMSQDWECSTDGHCELSFTNRRGCRKCRMDKCFAIGMKPKLVSKNKKNDTDKSTNPINNNELTLRSVLQGEDFLNCRLFDESLENSLPKSVSKNFFEFNQTELKYIDELLQSSSSIFNFEEANLPVLYEASNIYQVLNLEMYYVKRIIKYCMSNSVFRSLNEQERLKVLKIFTHKFLKIRHAFAYDARVDGYYSLGSEDGNCSVVNKSAAFYISSEQTVKQLVDFKVKQTILLFEEMTNDKTIRDLLIAQTLYSCDQDISNAESLRYHYWIYNSLLLRYLQCKYKNMQKAQNKYSMLIKISHEMIDENKMKQISEVVQTLDRAQFNELAVEILNI